MLWSWVSIGFLLLTETFIYLPLPFPFLLMAVLIPFPRLKDTLHLGSNRREFQAKNKAQA